MDDVEVAIGEADSEPPRLPALHQRLDFSDVIMLGAVPFAIAQIATQL